MFYVQLFGKIRIFRDGEEIVNFSSKKAVLILAYILLKRTKFVSISEIGQKFYKGFSDSFTHKNLNVQLYYLRKDLGITSNDLSSEREFIKIERDIFRTDYDEFLELLASPGNSNKLEAFRPQEFLSGYSDEWINSFRKQLEEMLFHYLRYESEQETISEVRKAYYLVEHQLRMRAKPFVPVLAIANDQRSFLDVRFRRGDLIVKLKSYWILLLESSGDPIKTLEGVRNRMRSIAKLIPVREEEVLEILEQNLFKNYIGPKILLEEV